MLRSQADRPESSSASPGSSDGERRLIWGLLLVAAVLRVGIITTGGQSFWPDETRYNVSREAAALLLDGQIRVGLTLPLNTGEHPGFKLIGILPALVEAKLGQVNDLIPAFFFGTFSWLNLLLIWLCARRLGLSSQAQCWAVGLAVCSVVLFFQSRHLLPYDLSLCLALVGLWVGLKPEGTWRRALAVGLLCGAAFITYMAYWLMAGAVMLLCVLRGGWNPRLLVLRGLGVAVGFWGLVAGLWLLDLWGEGQLLANTRKFSTLVYTAGFGNGWWMPWEYLWHSEGLRLGLFAGALLWATFRCIRDPEHRDGMSPLFIGLVGFAVIYIGTAVASNRNIIVPTGRVIRVLVPFLCLLGGLMVEAFLRKTARHRWVEPLLLLVIVGSALGPFHVVLVQKFPNDFRREAAAFLQKWPPAPPGSYYRLVNVDDYVYKPELLTESPEETLLVADHPYQFLPYLDEGFSVAERRQRREIDHRMRLVQMAVPTAAQITGSREGQVTMRVQYPADRAGMSEPLLSVGRPGHGDLFFVRYTTPRQLTLGVENVGTAVLLAEPVEFEPGQEYELILFSGSMLPPLEDTTDRAEQLRRNQYGSIVSIKWNGREILRGLESPQPARPEEVVAGVNLVRADSAGTGFSGTIRDVVRGGYPALDADAVGDVDYGGARMVVWLPAAAASVPEPLLVVGVPGRATLSYVRVLPGGKAKLGAEFWGVGSFESEAVAAPPGVPTDIEVRFPALFPPVGDPAWGGVDRATQAARRSRLTILLNGRVVLDREVPATDVPPLPVSFGENPVGGSWVTNRFSGRSVHWRRLPLTER